MKCPKCQHENPEDSKFCLECGQKLELRCAQCDKALPIGAKFCNECGHSLLEPAEASPIDYSQPQSYTPRFLADKILTSRSAIEGERKLVTVLFADVANYTSIAEKLDPEEVHQIMDDCFKIMMDEIHKYEGTINQFMGDGVMALFGAPVAHEDHAQRACHAALSIQKAIGQYGDKVKKDTGVDFSMRIGLNSGPAIIGSIGDDLRMDYTAVGNTTNIASRLEGHALPGTILVSEDTHRLVKDFFELEPLGKVKVKGKKERLKAFEVIKASKVETKIEAAVVKGLTKFVGRKNSMAALMEPYETAKAGSGQVVGMVGEAGVGKSRLLLEFRNRLPQDEFGYLEGRCLHYGGSMPYLPILDILRAYFKIKEDDREFVIKKKIKEKALRLDEKLQDVLASFHDLLSLKIEDEEYLRLEPKVKRERTFEAVRDLLIRVSQNRTLVVAIEDMHWIDKTSEELLTYLIDWLAGAKIMLILLYRPEYTHQWGSKSYYNRIGLTHLTTQSSTELVEAILEGAEVVPELRELMLGRTSGNPLFMEELTHTLLENGSIQRKHHQYVLTRKASEIQVPDTIQGIIAARMDRLEESLKSIMQVASVIGREFAYRILQSITGMREELKSHLLNLQGLEFIYEKQLFPELEYIFKHALTQEVAYNSLLQKRRKEIHENTAKAIESLYPERLEEFYEMLAYHYSKSDNLEKAYQYLKSSGEKASRRYSPWEAFNFYREAITMLNQFPDTERNKREQINIRLLMSIPMFPLGHPENSIRILQQGKALARELADERSIAKFLSNIANCYGAKGKLLLAIKHHENCLQMAKKLKDFELIVRVTSELCISYARVGKHFRIAEVAPSTIHELERKKGESGLLMVESVSYCRLCSIHGLSLGLLGNFEEGRNYCEKSIVIGVEVGDPERLAAWEWHYGLLFMAKGDWKLAIEHFQKSIKHCEDTKFIMVLGWAWSHLGLAHCFLGDLETARKHAEMGMRMTDVAIELFSAIPYWVLSLIYLDLGKLRKAHSHIEKALQLSQKNNEMYNEGLSWTWLGRILGRTQPPQIHKAEECILKGIKILHELKIKPYCSQGHLFLGELYADTGQKEKALENLKKAESMFQEMGMDYWLARTHSAYAGLSNRNGERSKSKEHLGKAIEIFKEIGADGWLEKAQRELETLL